MTYNRKDLSVQVNIKTIKGYTMREIGALEDRIKRLEYYTVLNALELDTKTLSVKNDAGTQERFKNGIFADPFNDYTIGNTIDREFRIAIKSSQSYARPLYIENPYNLRYATSENVKVNGKLAMLDYSSVNYGGNKHATNYRNCTEFFYKWDGILKLYPNFDNRNVTTTNDAQQVNIDLTKGFADLISTGIAKNIDTVVGNAILTGSDTVAWQGTGSQTTNHWAQTTTTTVTDLSVTAGTPTVAQDLGNYITNVGTLPYMRSRRISCVATGMRPNTRLYVYFDKVPVTNQCAPAYVSGSYQTDGAIDSTKITNLIIEQKEDEILTQVGNYEDAIYSDMYGNVYFIFLLPPGKFRAGDRTMILTNVNNIAADDAVVTRTEAVYTSSALSVTQNSVKFNVIQPNFSPTTYSTPVTGTWDTTTYVAPPPVVVPPIITPPAGDTGPIIVPGDTGPVVPYNPDPSPQGNNGESDSGSNNCGGGGCGGDPIAETFTVADLSDQKKDTLPGIYLTQIGVYFHSKSNTMGVSCIILGTTVGMPDSNQILGSGHLLPQYITTSEDASAETIFTLDTPVLIEGNKSYAFVIRPDGNNPDYEIFYSDLGGNDILTGESVTQQPFAGNLFVSSNFKSWTAVQSSDIKFNAYRAKFNSTHGNITFKNESDDFLSLSYLLRANTANPIIVGDVVYAANSSGSVLSDASQYPFGVVEAVDELNKKVYLEKSNGLFDVSNYPNLVIYRVAEIGNTAQLIGTNLVANCTLLSIDDIPYHSIVPKFNYLEPINTTVKLKFEGTSNTHNLDSNYTSPINENLLEFHDYERVLRSYSNEIKDGNINGSVIFDMALSTTDDYISPVVDLSAKTINYITNIISQDITGEDTRYGKALNKYISKPITLNQESEDLNVYITGYRPYGTDILVYGKFLNTHDTDNFNSKSWTRLTNQNSESYSSPQDLTDAREYLYNVPVGATSVNEFSANAYLDSESTNPTKILTYYDSRQEMYTGYNTFAIKIVLIGNNPVVLPTMNDVRAIALMR